jgi:hypothetical protein
MHAKLRTTANQCPVRLTYQPPLNSTFVSEQTNHHQPTSTSLRTNQHQPNEQGANNKVNLAEAQPTTTPNVSWLTFPNTRAVHRRQHNDDLEDGESK